MRGHERQVQPTGVFRRKWQADNAAAVTDKHGHLRHTDLAGRKNEVALVFPVRIIHNQHAAAVAQGGKGSLQPLGGIAKGIQS